MSQNGNEASEQERAERPSVSVYDFLYHDARRVGSFLSQFEDAGLLTQVLQSDETVRGAKRGWKASVGGNVTGVGGGNLAVERTPDKGVREAAERTYDPFWTNALTLLDFLEDQGLIQRDLTTARIGQIVLMTGTLLLFDLNMLRAAWDAPEIRRLFAGGIQQALQAGLTGKTKAQEAKLQSEQIFAFLKIMPHSLQARLLCETGSIWCSLENEAMVGRASDLMLKHGTMINGSWSMLGVLDAFPFTPNPVTEDGRPLQEAIGAIAGTPMGMLSAQLAPLTQQMLGRPPGAYGVTPILVFREVSG